MVVLVKDNERMYYCIYLGMLAVQAYCNATVHFIHGALAHFEKVRSSVVVPI